MMFPAKYIPHLIVFVMIASSLLWVKSLNDKVVQCKANTKIMKAQHKLRLSDYEKNIEDIVEFYDGRINTIDTFEGRSDETDCESSKRFLDGFSY